MRVTKVAVLFRLFCGGALIVQGNQPQLLTNPTLKQWRNVTKGKDDPSPNCLVKQEKARFSLLLAANILQSYFSHPHLSVWVM